MAIPLTQYQTSVNGAYWIDVNTLVSMNSMPDRLPDEQGITYSSLFNLFNCPIGGRGRIFEPTYGSILYQILQEPVDELSTQTIQIGFIQAIARWEPRIVIDYSNTYVLADYTMPGYRIRLAYTVNLSKQRISQDFNLYSSSGG